MQNARAGGQANERTSSIVRQTELGDSFKEQLLLLWNQPADLLLSQGALLETLGLASSISNRDCAVGCD